MSLANKRRVFLFVIVSIVMIMLYITGPITAILGAMLVIMYANIANANMNGLFTNMVEEACVSSEEKVPDWNVLSLRNVTYRYECSDWVKVGPLDLTISHDDRYFWVADNLIKFESGI